MPAILNLKLYMLLLGSKAPGRNVEQHDYFFGIAQHLKELVPEIKAFWPEAGNNIHIDGWREVNFADNFRVTVAVRGAAHTSSSKKLFFINLGSYQHHKLEEQHYTVLTVQDNRTKAIQEAKNTVFFKTDTVMGTNPHIDDKYGIDVDDIYEIEDILPAAQKEQYTIYLTPVETALKDEIQLGYFKLDKLKDEW